MVGSSFGIGTPFATPFATSGIGPYQGIGLYNPAAALPQIVQALQILPQQVQQLQQQEWAQQQQLQQVQQLIQVVAYQVQHLTQQLGAQGASLGSIAPQILGSPFHTPFQTMVSPSAFSAQPVPVM